MMYNVNHRADSSSVGTGGRAKRPGKAGVSRVDTVDTPREGGANDQKEPLYGVPKWV